MTEALKIVCAWCPDKKVIGGDPNGTKISHGICAECEAKQIAAPDPIDALRDLVKAGREFLLSLEDAEATTGDDGTELDDVTQFRAALDWAAKAVRP